MKTGPAGETGFDNRVVESMLAHKSITTDSAPDSIVWYFTNQFTYLFISLMTVIMYSQRQQLSAVA